MVNITHEELLISYRKSGIHTDKSPTRFRQEPNNTQTNMPDKEFNAGHTSSGLKRNLSAGPDKCETSNQEDTRTRDNTITLSLTNKSIENQSYEEWLFDYNSSNTGY